MLDAYTTIVPIGHQWSTKNVSPVQGFEADALWAWGWHHVLKTIPPSALHVIICFTRNKTSVLLFTLRSQDSHEDFGYEQWLEYADQEETERSPKHMLPMAHQTSAPGDYTLLPVHQDGALRVYLRSLGKSRSGVSYEEWLNEKEMEINKLVKEKNSNFSWYICGGNRKMLTA